jgi:alpha-ribazole phosphatase
LSAAGYVQTERLGDRLANEKIDAVYSSDLKRAMETAEGLSSRHEVDIVTCPELREANYGECEGLTFDEIRNQHPDVAKLIANFDLSRLKFPDGESFEEFTARVSTFLDRLKNHHSSETIVIAAHAGPIRVLVCRLLGIGMEHWRQIGCDNASLSIVNTHPRGAILNLLNDTSHLREAG